MQEVTISEFKAKCLSLIEQVFKTKKPIRVTKFGKPIADVVPPAKQDERANWLGSMRGKMEITGDILSPATDANEWEVLRD